MNKKKTKYLDKDKKCPVKMWKIANRLSKVLRKIYNYHAYKSKLWQGEFEFVGRDSFSNDQFRVDLKDSIEEMF